VASGVAEAKTAGTSIADGHRQQGFGVDGLHLPAGGEAVEHLYTGDRFSLGGLPMALATSDRPSLALLLRVIYQHHSRAIESALRAEGFNDIAPSAGNVFPWCGARTPTTAARDWCS
jgi:hypothetical protein